MCFEKSKLYRDLKLRGAVVNANRTVNQLPDEKIVSKYDNIQNLSRDEGNVGTFFFTNVRVIWFS